MGRRLGQHFLRDPGILDRIVDAIDPAPDDVVLEIGAGQGDLTRRLARRVGAVIAVEKDPRLALGLGPSALGGNVRVIHADALDLDWSALTPKAQGPRPRASFKITGNIPYYITSPLIDKALEPPPAKCVVFLVQKEVADRVVSPPGSKTYGALSVGVQTVARAERLFTVRAGAFAPPPEVDSAVLRMLPLDSPLLAPSDRPAYRRFVTALFGQRRKQLARSLRDVAGIDRDGALALLERTGLPASARPEVLTPAEFVALFRNVKAN